MGGSQRDWEDKTMRKYMVVELRARAIPNPHDEDDCWQWEGPLHDGYAHASVETPKGKRWWAMHVISLAEKLGRWPKDITRHRCGNRTCTNPRHLCEGDAAKNALDLRCAGPGPQFPRVGRKKDE